MKKKHPTWSGGKNLERKKKTKKFQTIISHRKWCMKKKFLHYYIICLYIYIYIWPFFFSLCVSSFFMSMITSCMSHLPQNYKQHLKNLIQSRKEESPSMYDINNDPQYAKEKTTDGGWRESEREREGEQERPISFSFLFTSPKRKTATIDAKHI